MPYCQFMQVVLDSLDLAQAERKLCAQALNQAGTIIEAASLLGITRHALKRRITKHRIAWPPPEGTPEVRPVPMQQTHDYPTRLATSHQDPRMLRAAHRSNAPMAVPPMQTPPRHNPPTPPMAQHNYDRRPPMDNNSRLRPAPPHQHGMPNMPNMMAHPDLRKFDR